MTTSTARIVVTDSGVLINLMHVSRLSLLPRIPGYEFIVPDHVCEEITNPEQRTELDGAIATGCLKVEAIVEIDALVLFTELIAKLSGGEAACIALAAKRGWYVASDDKCRFLREAEARLGRGRVVGTLDIFVLAIRTGLISVREADLDKDVLESRKLRVPFRSYGELLNSQKEPS